jgi:dTDP-glucose pyrophosphorylase
MRFINEIYPDATILESLKKMDEIGKKLLVITDKQRFVNVLSIGDIQRAIINNIDLSSSISCITRSIITVASETDDLNHIKSKMLELRTECMPVVSQNGELINVIFWEDLFDNQRTEYKEIDCPVVIMAGGQGLRLRPFTNVLPKPLMPFGKKTMIETIIDSFVRHNCSKYFLSVNYKAELIKYYLQNVYPDAVDIRYFQEDQPLGTAGSLYLLKDEIDSTFFVSNCDILVEQDYSEILDYHRQNKNELTVVAALKHLQIPYGTLETGESGVLIGIQEKPELSYLINSGLYILEPHLLKEIPENKFYHITSLMQDLISKGRRVGVFPVSEKSWKDIGEWHEFSKNFEN